ncbi:MAG TPA: riboflavin synthase [Gemmatimonadaceae bacterium]|nr:riboflavin synthase [Gemmatimonadaceae bacterium]
MFTGLVDDVGTITAVETGEAGREFRIACRYDDLADGESIACAGACLTVREHGAGWFTVAAVVTTLARTTIGDWGVGRRLNLERSLRAGDRLGGHIVQGHVDGVGEVVATARSGDAWLIDIGVPPDIAELLVPHGSICVDGVSLTVNEIPRPGILQVSIIEYTLRHTTLGGLSAGDRVHLEGDVVGKYVRALTRPYLPPGQGS